MIEATDGYPLDARRVELAVADLRRLQELAAYPTGHAGAWDEAEARAGALARALTSGLPADIATKLRHQVGYVRSAKPGGAEARERGRLTDLIWRLGSLLDAVQRGV